MKTITELEKGCGRRTKAQYKHYIRGINCGEFWDRKGEICYCPECEAKLQTLQEVCEEIEKEITKYKKGKLEDSNFTVEDRAVSMVVLQTLLKKFQGEGK